LSLAFVWDFLGGQAAVPAIGTTLSSLYRCFLIGKPLVAGGENYWIPLWPGSMIPATMADDNDERQRLANVYAGMSDGL
jgi:hypothetical protein